MQRNTTMSHLDKPNNEVQDKVTHEGKPQSHPPTLSAKEKGEYFKPRAYQLSVEGGEEAIWGDDDRASREGLPILVQGVQVVSGGRGLGNGPTAQEHEDITISLDVGEEAGHPSVAPVKPHPGEQVAQQIRLCDGAVNV